MCVGGHICLGIPIDRGPKMGFVPDTCSAEPSTPLGLNKIQTDLCHIL